VTLKATTDQGILLLVAH